jgi:hypothetical protein
MTDGIQSLCHGGRVTAMEFSSSFFQAAGLGRKGPAWSGTTLCSERSFTPKTIGLGAKAVVNLDYRRRHIFLPRLTIRFIDGAPVGVLESLGARPALRLLGQ